MKVFPRIFSSIFLIIFLFFSESIFSQDTFSIVAVDTITGEIGSAGASCIAGSFILSDVIEGIGAIHTQAYWNATNQQNAHNRMLEGLSPQEIIDWLVANDAQGNPTIRQYGIVDLTRNGESAAYTGINCDDYKNHVTGPGYAIQGNILLEQIIINTMQTAFLNTEGPLADKLMATLQAAKIPGADTRCTQYGKSSISGFVKVVRIGDASNPYLQIVVSNTPTNKDPIDSLQTLFDNWKESLFTVVDPFLSQIEVSPDTLPADGTSQAVITISPKNNSDTLLASGMQVVLSNTGAGLLSSVTDLGDGTYEATVTAPIAIGTDTISAIVISGADTVSIFWNAIITYVNPTSINENLTSPDKFYLYQNYPQPFNPSTTIKYQIPKTSFVSLKVFDALGREVVTLVNEEKTYGNYEVEFDGSALTSGIYFYTLKAGGYKNTKKMLLIK
ncbi:MAG: DUF1028 domain-containing protein [Ignavibacteriaceae bacterium]|nr:DUF1028 domain-containing protein [Ignavibacteriaceae bacterium]MCW9094693.1 DUF1028 domain-containing protein [Ignavibacteriaceae bacterium]